MINCPCCGYRTIDDSFIPIDEICEVCYWQYDEMANRNPERVVGPNSISLNEARENYIKFGACEERFIKLVRKTYDEECIS